MMAVTCVNNSAAQTSYTRVYQSGTSYTLDLIELPGHNILTAMGGTLLLDPNGYVDHASFYYGGGTYLPQTVKAQGANVHYFTTGYDAGACPWGSSALRHPVLGKMDSLGAVLSMRLYTLNNAICGGLPGGLEVTADDGAITWGRMHNFFAMKVDANLDPAWSYRIDRSGGFRFIKELPGGDLLAGINMDTAGVVVARMDPEGNFIWCKSYIRPRGMVHDALIESDDSFIITGTTDSTASTNPFIPYPPTYHPKLFMMKLGGDGEVQWCKGYDSAPYLWYAHQPSRIVKTLDGKYLTLGTLGYPFNGSPFRPYLMKTDLNGDTLWTRSVGKENYDYLAVNVLPYSDHGFLMNGIIYGDLPGGNTGLIYIAKTDSVGHLSCSERVHTIQVTGLFPVDSSFTLTPIAGVTIVDVVLVNDSILDTHLFVTYDGCTFTTGMPPSMAKGRPMKAYPNPNTGRFTLEFQDPLMAQSYYSMYDSLGKLLYQRPLPKGATLEEIDLSRYGRGSYVIRFTSPEGVCHERVVVE
jgi:hypothetical protein